MDMDWHMGFSNLLPVHSSSPIGSIDAVSSRVLAAVDVERP